MRVWDINPGYLNQQSLLGEHCELHGIVSIIVSKKKGYSKHPETLRWIGHGWALRQRHQLLAVEMALRGLNERSPVLTRANKFVWPTAYINEPFQQFQLLKSKYRHKKQGRIPLPENAQQLWSHHKYSVLARDISKYRQVGQAVSKMKPLHDFSDLAMLLTELLRRPPTAGGIRNALQHMWGHVSDYSSANKVNVESWSLNKLLREIQQRALASKEPYLTSSTALGELMVWIPGPA